ncbi:MAG: hypothetical protein KDL87_08350 [Verrucomicrobiae bacterium]|nr:hypothetical protein [Verrucomicrobiae bacterium]
MRGVVVFAALALGAAQAREIVIDPPGGDQDAVPLFVRALERAKAEGISAIRIKPGDYHIHPDMAPERFVHVSNHDHGLRRTALPIWEMEGLTIEAEGARLLAHRQAFIPVTIHDSKNITIKGLTIDWAEPLVLQGTVESVDPGSNSFVARMEHPERVVVRQNAMYYGDFNQAAFLGNRPSALWQMMPHQQWVQNPDWTHWIDSKDGTVLDTRRQKSIRGWDPGKKRAATVEKVGDDRYRFTSALPYLPKPGHVFVSKGMASPNRMSPAIHLRNSVNAVMSGVTIHHSGGMGLIGQRCENVAIERMRVTLPEGSGRWVSTLADATHFNLCKGSIVIKDSVFEYMLDDACNVHGVSAPVVAQTGPRTVCGELGHFQQAGLEFARPGERLRFSKQSDMVAYGERTVESCRFINATRFEVTFSEPVEGFVKPGSFMDNLDCQPDFTFTGNRVANNRARSLIFSTAGKVRIADNHFEHPVNESIKVLGDANFWFESGPVRDVTIENNVFIARSPMAYVLEFGPEEPRSAKGIDVPFHSNIRVVGNEFHLASPRIMSAHRVDGLEFRENVIKASKWFVPGGRAKSLQIERCKNVTISGNTVNVAKLNLER